jgi:predicted anti-sigma-YlaC factor YlaD
MAFRKLPSSQCADFEVLLEDFLEGDLSLQDAWHVEQHLSICQDCRGGLEMARQSGVVLRSLIAPSPDLGDAFTQSVMIALRRKWAPGDTPLLSWKPFEVLAQRLALVASFALMLLVAYGVGRSSATSPVQAVSPAQASRTVDELIPGAPSPATGSDAVILTIAENDRGK